MMLIGATKRRSDLQSELKAGGKAAHSQESIAFKSEPVHKQMECVIISKNASDGSDLVPALCFTDGKAEATKATNIESVTQRFLSPFLMFFSSSVATP